MNQVCGLELHSKRMWDWASTRRAVDFMVEAGMNALIFHQVDIIDHLVLSEGTASRSRWSMLARMQSNNIAYINQVIKLVHSKNIKFFLEVKEPWYPEELLYVHPELINSKGQVCPSNPFWFEFSKTKIKKLLDVIPDIDGIIESSCTAETKVSLVPDLSLNYCTCERCRETDLSEWNKNVILSLYEPLKEKGKQLIIRDFTKSPENQDALLNATGIPKDVIICLKNTPHDWHPTFPNNPRIGEGEYDQWIEFDTWGQFWGLGIFPCILLNDFRERLEYARDKKVKGYICRVDWEGISEGWVLDSVNLINLYGLAKLGEDLDCKFDDIFRNSLKLLDQSAIPFLGKSVKVENPTELTTVSNLLLKTWPIIEGSLHIKGHLFQGSSVVLDSFEGTRHMRIKNHNLTRWAPDRQDPLKNLNSEGLKELLSEKEEALHEVRTIVKALRENKLNLNRELNTSLLSLFEAFEIYIEGFCYSGKAYILTEYALSAGDTEDKENAIRSINLLEDYGRKLEEKTTRYLYEPQSHVISLLLDPQRISRLHESLLNTLNSLKPLAKGD